MTLLSGPNIAGNEWKYVKDCLDTGWVSSVGAYVSKFEDMMSQFTKIPYAVATSCGTTALHISLILSDVSNNDYVIVPNITFVASLNSIKYTGADPIMIDIDEYTWQMDLNLLETFLEGKTIIINNQCIYRENNRVIKAIMPVHVLGNMCNMDNLKVLADKFHLTIIEDATESLGSYFNNKHSGNFGKFACFSFNGNKIITTGGGGMIMTHDKELANKARHLTTQAKSDPFEYSHDEIGYNYRLVNVLAAIGVAQMEQLCSFIERKREIANYYKNELQNVGDISFQNKINDVNTNNWLFTIRTTKQKLLLKELNKKELQSRPFWVPMNKLIIYRNNIYVTDQDISGKIYQECLSIPCSTYISTEELDNVINTIKNCF